MFSASRSVLRFSENRRRFDGNLDKNTLTSSMKYGIINAVNDKGVIDVTSGGPLSLFLLEKLAARIRQQQQENQL